MTDAPHEARPRRGLRGALIFGGMFLALTVLLVLERRGEVGLWDWDTYGRMQFIHDYRPAEYVDGHLLYHGVMRFLMAVGFRDVGAIVVETALGASAFICLLAWICRREGLSRGATTLVVVAGTIGSPGLVALFLMAEDNVLYLPILLGAFYLLYLPTGDRRTTLRRGVLVGVLIAAAMLINVSLLVMLFAVLAAIVVVRLWVGDKRRALGLLVALGTALATYYLAHLVPFTGAKNALHEFLPQALGLQDFHQSTTPLLSLERFAEYRGGLRAIALTPNLHMMTPPPGLRAILVSLLPVVIVVLAVALGGWLVRFRRAELVAGIRARLDLLALFGVSVTFPYFYEPALIERWDLFWVGWVFLLVPLLRAKPSRFAVGLIVAMLAVQGVGTLVTIAHHYGAGMQDPALARTRALARAVNAQASEVVVLPFSLDRLLIADLLFRIGSRPTVYLVRDDGDAIACFRVVLQVEHPIETGELLRVLQTTKRVHLDASLTPNSRKLLGR